ncbi:GtrA family protein [Nocardioides dongxiaopingii]|uniref:GtrA family protein n=1 Tax=Nocardioides dongxiaopingii TaxID=2576036 RepID=UPI0010C76E80|nr:GtrA family protein [Nocardioides dongxiaopingii]
MKPVLSPTLVRFAGVGVVNTALDLGLFLLLHDRLGIVLANFVSTSAGMTFSFVVNGLFTFSAGRLTLRHALLFLASTGTVMWLFQPLVIHLLVDVVEPLPVVKVLSIAVSFVANFVAYRYVVWPTTEAGATP